MVPAIGIRVEVVLQILVANDMMNAIDAPLDEAPKALDGVGVGIAADVDFGAVVDWTMLVARPCEAVVAGEFVGEHGGAWQDMLSDIRHQSPSFHIGCYFGDYSTVSLYHPHSNCLTSSPSATLAGPFAPDVGFVNFYLARKGVNALGHAFANQRKHAPRSLVSDTQLSFKLLGRDAAPSRGHQEYGKEPRTQRSSGLVENRIGTWRNIAVAEIAGVYLAAIDAVVLCYALTFLAIYPIWPAQVLEVFKTSILTMKLLAEVVYRKVLHRFYPLTISIITEEYTRGHGIVIEPKDPGEPLLPPQESEETHLEYRAGGGRAEAAGAIPTLGEMTCPQRLYHL
jgi:hypothetical protein